MKTVQKFKARLEIIGINPFVFVPNPILQSVLKQAGKDKGPIPIKGTVNKKPYKQTLVRYSGHWRLYVNLTMLDHSPKRIGEKIEVTISFDAEKRELPFHPALKQALNKNKEAKRVFEKLRPSRQTEINKYISMLKGQDAIDRNIARAIGYLLGKNTFVGNTRLD